MSTIYEVSKLAGVSLATVSRVINKNAAVSEKTKEKVKIAMEQLGYRPNTIAQSLASNRSNSIGVLVSQLDSPFFGEMMVGIEDEMRKAGKQVLFAAGHNLESMEKESIEFLQSRNCDGLIVHCEQASDEYMHSLTKGKTSVVIVNRKIPMIEDRCVTLDNFKGGYIAAQYAVAQGHTQLAYVSGPHDKKDSLERLQGVKAACKDLGIELEDSHIETGDYSEKSGSDAISAFIEKGYRPSILICANDEMASGAMKRARELEIDIPKELSIIGYDNTSFTKYLHPELTTVENPIGKMGKMAAKLILNLAYDQKNVIHNRFEPEMVIRNSVYRHD
ncbi:LacI family DNA-binding transcriptional regulator [Glaciecola sp. KUL10]|uniref:LacI family DNA-binding transcriptional regulator n=1 Tax=Glaciecola sp. (strain KUL10) TaxID=2161813 RepID=UPI000D7896D1|nr:LacI family DNA-binding transcriptional regulator [Glaciecola sp. KUL10]GBL05395.1 HTH-type transcriptional regulator GalR [Glaciecola sp. KUL10]